uniref:Uncharacterized protein n=1 Tax=Cannabis sativa TaxID=3483 RepID=A0A803NNB4_CANSA
MVQKLLRKSLVVAAGELFLGLASRLINKPNRGPNGEELASIAMFENYGSVVRSKNERIGAVIEDEIELDVVWEQSVMDVEAEKLAYLSSICMTSLGHGESARVSEDGDDDGVDFGGVG